LLAIKAFKFNAIHQQVLPSAPPQLQRFLATTRLYLPLPVLQHLLKITSTSAIIVLVCCACLSFASLPSADAANRKMLTKEKVHIPDINGKRCWSIKTCSSRRYAQDMAYDEFSQGLQD
jgi:hypothetical protein